MATVIHGREWKNTEQLGVPHSTPHRIPRQRQAGRYWIVCLTNLLNEHLSGG